MGLNSFQIKIARTFSILSRLHLSAYFSYITISEYFIISKDFWLALVLQICTVWEIYFAFLIFKFFAFAFLRPNGMKSLFYGTVLRLLRCLRHWRCRRRRRVVIFIYGNMHASWQHLCFQVVHMTQTMNVTYKRTSQTILLYHIFESVCYDTYKEWFIQM